ncbi:BZ3500_MvSof-1268-A1-R1_Chr5-3g08331 [Microbotryum saponariae]|uniref:BZ3500_MvSof-1268-A1-R1_Chr5-3g08331 protein n=1 Tax=Microbotryum saponariae TaxID=289078 RepID=A0A2X0LR46_9BASI|nr:BZ3500_MvSof-1268-A1-R1_Chr5-3g08331 [Microbotryum saponariae]SDA08439.1 BZ3501_MvSof-1269-A2-R1_Chr5-3g08059 [Microbotryum saponariae]
MALTSQAKSLYAELQRHQLNPDQVPTPQLNNLFNQLKVSAVDSAVSWLFCLADMESSSQIHLAESGLLFPTASPSTEQEKADLVIAREYAATQSRVGPHLFNQSRPSFTGDVLEFGALFSIQTEDVPSFERYMSLLSAFYAEPSQVSPSPNRAALSALSLLRLLSQNRIAEFHTTLETLSSDLILSREITWVLELERSLMEGSYSKVYSLCSNPSNLPRVEFEYFISTLLSTVRSEIASCDERAYATLPLRDAQTLLFFSNESDVRAFAKERGWSVDEAKGIIRFGVQSGPLKANKSTEAGWGLGGDKEMNKERIVASVVGYAKELESIV